MTTPSSSHGDSHRRTHHLLERIDQRLNALEESVNAIAATLADLDTALDGLAQTITDGNAAILAAVQAIVAKVGPAVDLTAEVARIKAAQQSVTDEVAAVQALDVTPSAKR